MGGMYLGTEVQGEVQIDSSQLKQTLRKKKGPVERCQPGLLFVPA